MAKKTIAIIGAAEDSGVAITSALARGNYRLLLFGHDNVRLKSLERNIKATTPSAEIDCMNCVIDASWEADIIIMAIYPELQKEVAGKIRDFATQKIVISISDPGITPQELCRNGQFSAAEELQKLLPNSIVVNAFNIRGVREFEHAVAAGEQLICFISGDNPEAIKTVVEIITNAGFHPIVAGGLLTGRVLENTTRQVLIKE
jgi:predicted dinucleotide-binding enzyme